MLGQHSSCYILDTTTRLFMFFFSILLFRNSRQVLILWRVITGCNRVMYFNLFINRPLDISLYSINTFWFTALLFKLATSFSCFFLIYFKRYKFVNGITNGWIIKFLRILILLEYNLNFFHDPMQFSPNYCRLCNLYVQKPLEQIFYKALELMHGNS